MKVNLMQSFKLSTGWYICKTVTHFSRADFKISSYTNDMLKHFWDKFTWLKLTLVYLSTLCFLYNYSDRVKG